MFTFSEKDRKTIAAADCQSRAEIQKSIAANFHFFPCLIFFFFKFCRGWMWKSTFNGWNWDDFEKYKIFIAVNY